MNPVAQGDIQRLAVEGRRLAGVARVLGLAELAGQIEHDLDRRLDQARLRVALVGRVGRGKSTLANALAGCTALPMGVTPTTAAPVLLRPGGPPGPHVVGADGMSEPLDPEAFAARVRAGGGARLEVGLALAGAPEFELLDTPGVSDTREERGQATRDTLPQADVLVLLLDATQLFGRTEQRFLEDAVAALGGLGSAGATLLVAINRVDMVPESEHRALRAHIGAHLGGVDPQDVFMTSGRAALGVDDLAAAADPAVAEVARLRARLDELAAARGQTLPLRQRAALLRQAKLLDYHAAIQARALTLSDEVLAAELRRVEEAREGLAQERAAQAATLRDGAHATLAAARERLAEFRQELEASASGLVDYASLSVLADRLPGSIHDACVSFLQQESEHLRAAMEDLTRKVLRTHADRARARLEQAALRLGAHGPTVYVEPPSVLLEAGSVALGVAGTAIMYFGSVITGMVMTIAGPMATVLLREQSVRRARARVRAALPAALDRAVEAIDQAMAQAVEEHVAALSQHIELSDRALGDRLTAQLRHASARLVGGDGRSRRAAQDELARARASLAQAQRSLERWTPGAPAPA